MDTATFIGSQHTVRGVDPDWLKEQFDNLPKVPTSVPSYGGLEEDKEGKETRKEMLARRRKECAVEEVDVALAPVMRIPVPYVFYPQQYRAFREMFPRVTPDSGLSYTHHDHPVAHTATLVGTRKIQSMLRPGELALDLNGNPTANEKFNSFQSNRVTKRPHLPTPPLIETMVSLNSAMDAVRKVTKWGPKRDEFGVQRWFEGNISDVPAGLYDVFISIHTLYYYSMYEVNALLSANPNARLIALVNYSPEQCGTLYGELKYSKSDGLTVQTSPNGELYRHPDIDRWFQCNSFRGATEQLGTGISWTSTCLGGPMYAITITSCPWELARRHCYEPAIAPTLTVGRGSIYFAWVRCGDTNVQLRISNHGLASELRHWMTLRDRNDPETFLGLCVKARRVTSPDLVQGVRQFSVNDGELADHITYAYLVDAPGELELLEGVKLLRGSLLTKHSEALKFEGKLNVHGIFSSTKIYQFFTRPAESQALGGRAKKKVGFNEQLQPPGNKAGLIPVKRT